jgi:hypothetical protein
LPWKLFLESTRKFDMTEGNGTRSVTRWQYIKLPPVAKDIFSAAETLTHRGFLFSAILWQRMHAGDGLSSADFLKRQKIIS